MKKHLGLFLFVMQNVCAMELDPFGMMLKYDEKCKLVAKYLYKYPKGRNEEEAGQIRWFLKDDRAPSKIFLLECINKHKNMLQNIEAEKMLHDMHTEELPSDIKQKIFRYALWSYVEQSYAFYNTCQFTAMSYSLIPYNLWGWPYQYYMPCFLAEIQEHDDQYVFFSKTKLDKNSTMSEQHDCRIASHMFYFDDNEYFGEYNNHSPIDLFCCTKTIRNGNTLLCMPISCKMCELEDFVRFLEQKELRVAACKQSFGESIKKLVSMNDEKATHEFIRLLTLYKQSPQTTVSMYKRSLPQSIHITLDNLPSMYEREIQRKSIQKSAISGLQHLS
jgi:hypothetical protein